MIDIEKWKSLGSFISNNWQPFLVGTVAGITITSWAYEKFLLPSSNGRVPAVEAGDITVSRNVALTAVATAKLFYNDDFTYHASNVNDDNRSTEWAADHATTGEWVRLDWDEPRTISSLKLYDRLGEEDQIIRAKIGFSDGSERTIGLLQDVGLRPGEVELDEEKTVSWIRVTIEEARGPNTGLSELEVYGR